MDIHVGDSISLADLTAFGVHLGDCFNPKMTTLNLHSDRGARLKVGLEVLLHVSNNLFLLDEASEWREADKPVMDFIFINSKPRSS